MKSFLGNFYRHFGNFFLVTLIPSFDSIWSQCHKLVWKMLKMSHSRYLFLYFRSSFQYSFLIKLIINNSADDWIQTADLWHWKQLLYQLCHNHCPWLKMFGQLIRVIQNSFMIYEFLYNFRPSSLVWPVQIQLLCKVHICFNLLYGQSRPLFFVLFTVQFKLKNSKRRCCAWDSNPGTHVCRRNWIRWAMAAATYLLQFYLAKPQTNCTYSVSSIY